MPLPMGAPPPPTGVLPPLGAPEPHGWAAFVMPPAGRIITPDMNEFQTFYKAELQIPLSIGFRVWILFGFRLYFKVPSSTSLMYLQVHFRCTFKYISDVPLGTFPMYLSVHFPRPGGICNAARRPDYKAYQE
jgi:hypothetical protein